MVKGTVLAVLVAVSQVNPKAPDLYVDAKLGFSINKPPKKEEWDFKTGGFKTSNSNLAVVNKVEDVGVEIMVIEPPANAGRPLNNTDVKPQAEAEYEAQAKKPEYESVAKKKLEECALPGNAAGGVKAWHLEMRVKPKQGAEFEWRHWMFVAKESKFLVKVIVITPVGGYEKNKKDLDQIMSTLRTFKQAKK